HVGRSHRLVLIDDQPRAMSELHAERQRDAQKLLVRALRLNEHCRGHRLARLDARILAREADFLSVGIPGLAGLALPPELGPGREDQLHLLLAVLRLPLLAGLTLGSSLRGVGGGCWGSGWRRRCLLLGLRGGLRLGLLRLRSRRGGIGLLRGGRDAHDQSAGSCEAYA